MEKLSFEAIHDAIRSNRYFITAHAKLRMGQRRVSNSDLKEAIYKGKIINTDLKSKPYPKAIIEAEIEEETYTVVCAFDGTHAYIITVWVE